MQPKPDNPTLPSWLRQATFAAALGLLAAGGGLFFLPAAAHGDWPWDLGPFSGLFLGAIYLSALAAVGGMFYYARWAPARLVLPMTFVFTASVFFVSLLNLDRFDWTRWPAWLWIGLHLALPLVLGPYLWRHRGESPPLSFPTSDRWRRLLLIAAAVLGLYGSSLFLFGAWAAGFWPWPVDGFNAQLYGVVFSTAAVGALGLAQWAAPVERLTLGVTYAMLGLFALFSVLISDAALLHVNWASPGVWLWFALFGALFLIGLALIWWSSGHIKGSGRVSAGLALVTGAGRGTGREVALALGAAGARVVAIDVNPDAAQRTAAEIGAAAMARQADISNKMAVQTLLYELLEAGERLAVLVNAAHISPRTPALTLDEWEWNRALDVNLKGAFLMAQTVARAMKETGGGLIFNVVRPAETEQAAASAARAGLSGLTRALALEWTPLGVRVELVEAAGDAAAAAVLAHCAGLWSAA